MLRNGLVALDDAAGRVTDTNWSSIENRLLRLRLGDDFPENLEASSLRRVANSGKNPRSLSWQIEANDLHASFLPGMRPVTRMTSGRLTDSDPRLPRNCFVVPFDAVELGEKLLPGSSNWLNTPLWSLIGAGLPPLELVRECIQWGLRDLGLVRVPTSRWRLIFGEDAHQSALQSSEEQVYAAYEASLRAKALPSSPGWLTFLSGLVWESYLTDHDALHDIHRKLMLEAFRGWLAVGDFVPRLRIILERRLVAPIYNGGPLSPVWPTDPRDLLVPESEWPSQVSSRFSKLFR